MNFKISNIDGLSKVIFWEKNGKIKDEFKNLIIGFDGSKGQLEKVFVSGVVNFFVGIGKKEELTNVILKEIISKIVIKANESKLSELSISLIENCKIEKKDQINIITDIIEQSNYQFLKYKSEKKENTLKSINFYETEENIEKLKEHQNMINGKLIARNLVNEPSNHMMPLDLANYVEKLGRDMNFDVEIFDENQIKELNMESFISVAKASDYPYRLIVMRYMGNKNSAEKLGFIGKGLTYDTGGLSIKPTAGMKTMKTDMGGAAAVIGAISAIAKNKLNVNIVGVIAACENCVSGRSYRPGDIISSMAGKSIYIGNTDAEGRLTLIDAVHYSIEKESVTKIVDIATLTGSMVASLGTVATGVVSNDDDFYKELETASFITGEKIWRMPIFDEYKEMLRAKEADLTNSPGRLAGGITAGLFIGEFVQKLPWIHMDIAGTSYLSEKKYGIDGATGEGVYNLYKLAESYSYKK